MSHLLVLAFIAVLAFGTQSHPASKRIKRQ